MSFIILRYVNDAKSNLYWNRCYDCIRKYYPVNTIYIIDDHSKYQPVRIGHDTSNTHVINSDLPPGRGELLPYYYLLTKKFSKNAVYIHDTIFIHKKIDKSLLNTSSYHFMWTAEHKWDPDIDVLQILNKFDNSTDLINFYKTKHKWSVCFGGMAILNLDFIQHIFNNKNYMDILIDVITTRSKRMSFERIIAVLLSYYGNNPTKPVNGDIHKSLKWGTNYETYLKFPNHDKIYKIWTARKSPNP